MRERERELGSPSSLYYLYNNNNVSQAKARQGKAGGGNTMAVGGRWANEVCINCPFYHTVPYRTVCLCLRSSRARGEWQMAAAPAASKTILILKKNTWNCSLMYGASS